VIRRHHQTPTKAPRSPARLCPRLSTRIRQTTIAGNHHHRPPFSTLSCDNRPQEITIEHR
jgi:hypothetical protein